MVAGLLIRGAGAAIKGIGKAIKNSKRKARRKRLGLPAETKMQQRDRVKESASRFVKRKTQLSKKPKKSQAGKALKAGVAVGAGAFAAGQIAKEVKKLKKPKTIKPKLGLPPKK